MPIGFLTAADRARLNRFPEQIPHEDLSVFFLLSEADQRAINQQHSEAHTRLGFALQLCALRYLGFAPDDVTTVPAVAVEYVAQQLGVAPRTLTAYGTRRPTRTTDFQHVQAHLHFRLATPLDMYGLQTWLGERALEHDKPTLLLQLACDKLRRDHIVRPGLTRLERLIATARQQAHDETWRRLTPLVTADQYAWLDGLLQADAHTGRTVLNWLRREATDHTAPQLVETLQEGRVSIGSADRHLGPHRAQPQPSEMARPTGLESPHTAAPTDGPPATVSDPDRLSASSAPAPYRCGRRAL